MTPRSAGRGFRPLLTLAVAIVVAGLGALLIWGFVEGRHDAAKEAESEAAIESPLRVSTEDGAPVITVDTKTQQRNGIETTTLMPAPYRRQVRAYATVLDITGLTDLSNRYTNAKAQLQTVQAKLAASKRAFERARNLYKDQQNVSLAQLQTAEATFHADEASLGAATSQVHTLAATAHQAWGPVLAKSLVGGTPTVTRLIERQDFLLQVTLPPGVSLPVPPPKAVIQVDAKVRVPITLVSPATRTDPLIQGVSFFYTAPAGSGVLPGMNLLAFLPSGPTVAGIAIPPGAVVWSQDRAWVYRRETATTFTRIAIPTDQPAPAGGFVVTSLPKGAAIVTQGAQSLLSEEFRAQIQVDED